jgi:hypothetical protein
MWTRRREEKFIRKGDPIIYRDLSHYSLFFITFSPPLSPVQRHPPIAPPTGGQHNGGNVVVEACWHASPTPGDPYGAVDAEAGMRTPIATSTGVASPRSANYFGMAVDAEAVARTPDVAPTGVDAVASPRSADSFGKELKRFADRILHKAPSPLLPQPSVEETPTRPVLSH